MRNNKLIKAVSLHWGFIPGGGAAYASGLAEVGRYAPLRIKGLCLTAPGWPLDTAGLKALDMDLLEIKGRLDPSWIGRTRDFLKKARPDLILTHGVNGAFAAALSGVGLHIPIVSSWHGEYFPSTSAQRLRKPIFALGLKALFQTVVKEIVTVSDFSRQVLVRKGIKGSKITVIYNGIPNLPGAGKRQGVRESLAIPEDALLVGTACRLDVQKGLPWLLQAIPIMVEARRDLRFVIWGDGPLRQSLLDLVRELGISEYVHFPGYRPDIDQCLPSLDIFVMASFAEYFSIALLEAMRAGLPIVATNVGGNPEAIEDGVHGFLVPFADPQTMAARILTLAGDGKLRERLAAKARQRFLEEFTADKMVAKTAAWLMDCVRKYAPNAGPLT